MSSIEVQGRRFRLLTCLVLVGGLARLYALARYGVPGIAMLTALVLELVVTPGLAIWRERVQQILPRLDDRPGRGLLTARTKPHLWAVQRLPLPGWGLAV